MTDGRTREQISFCRLVNGVLKYPFAEDNSTVARVPPNDHPKVLCIVIGGGVVG